MVNNIKASGNRARLFLHCFTPDGLHGDFVLVFVLNGNYYSVAGIF